MTTLPLATVGTALLDAVRPGAMSREALEGLDLVLRKDVHGLVALSRHHRVQGMLHSRLVQLERLDPTVRAALHPDYLSGVVTNMRLTQELHRTASLLEELGVAWLSFKGPVLAETAYTRPELRVYGDVDVLVDVHDLEGVLDALHDSGAYLYSEPWSELERTRRAQLSVVTSHELPLDLHWNVFNAPATRSAFPVSTTELLRRRQPVTVAGRQVWGLDPADALVHLAAHGAQSGADQLVWSMDLHMAARRVLDWNDVVRTARRQRLQLVCAVMLHRSQVLLWTPLPAGLLDELSGAKMWRSMMAGLDCRRPPHRVSIGSGRVLMTSTRDTTAGSLRETLREYWSHALLPFLQEADHPWRVALRGSRPGPQSVDKEYGRLSLARSPDRDRFVRWAQAGG